MSLFFDDFSVGSRYQAGRRVITDVDHELFCKLVGYAVPLFLDDAYAQSRGLAGRICPSHLVMSFSTAMTSSVLAESVVALVGIGNARFLKYVRPGDELRTVVEVRSKCETSRADRGLVVFRDHVYNQHDEEVFRNDKYALIRRNIADVADLRSVSSAPSSTGESG